jgi:hypothetical protein
METPFYGMVSGPASRGRLPGAAPWIQNKRLTLKKIYQLLSYLFETIATFFLIAILITVILQVYFRYVARIVVHWT